MNNTKIWFSGEFACQVTQHTDGTCYWQVSAVGMMTRSGHVENDKTARREINAAKTRMLSKRTQDTTAPRVAAGKRLAYPRRHGRDRNEQS